MTVRRMAGTVKINGVSYLVARDSKGEYVYNRKNTPKAQLTTGLRGTASGEANMIEYSWGCDGGFGDSVITKNRDAYNYGMNFFMEHEGEAVVLPGALRHELSSGSYEPSKPPVAVFEIVDDSDQQDSLSTYILQDSIAWKVDGTALATGKPEYTYVASKTFEAKCNPSDATVFDNVAYVGMGASHRRVAIASVASQAGDPRFATTLAHNLAVGDMVRIEKSSHSTADTYNGIWIIDTVSDSTHFDIAALTYAAASPDVPVTAIVYKLSNRVLRRFRNGAWSQDDAAQKTISSIADNGSGKIRALTSTTHGYVVGDFIYLTNMTVAGYNSMSTAGVSVLYQITAVSDTTHFDVNAITYSATATGSVCNQDSDVYAEHLEIVGDIMVRSYEDAEGWKVSRVDIVNSNPMLDTNWTAGVGTKSVGSADSPITDIVAVGDGELVMKAEGIFDYNKKAAAYLNQAPELEEHRHPTNGKNSFEWKGWVYIPTNVGVFRWKNGTLQNVTPGRGGQQDFTTPIGPIGGFAGDTERLYAVTQPFKVSQPKNIVPPAPVRMYLDPTDIHPADNASDWGLDPQQELNAFSAAGYLYIGATKPWHRMYLEIDPIANSLAYGTTYTGLSIDAADYWNGTTWVAETAYMDFTRVRSSSVNNPSTMGQSGDIWFTGPVPSTWAVSGTAGSGGITLNTSYYWKRFSFSGAISNSIIIKRGIAGIHDANSTFTGFGTTDLQVDNGGVQFVLSMTEEQGKGVEWQTMWGWQPHEQTQSDGSTTVMAGGTQPVGMVAIVQPNKLRSGPTGTRWLFVGLHNTNYLCPLGHNPDPTEDGPYMQVFNSVGENSQTATRKAILVLPDSDCGLPYVNKSLQEVNFDTEGITVASDLEVFYRVDGGAWTTVGDVTVLPHRITAGSEPSGLQFGLAVVLTLSESTYVRLPRLATLPAIRLYARPEMSELITMSVELDSEMVLPGQSDRRVNKTSYAALTALQTNATSVPFSDADEQTGYVHVQMAAKRIMHNAENIPRVVADIILSVVPSA